MRKVAYCAAGTVVAFPIPQAVYDRHLAAHPVAAPADIGDTCATLKRAAAAARGRETPSGGAAAFDAACMLWRVCNEAGGFDDDIIVIDQAGNGRSVEVAPLSAVACGRETGRCPCGEVVTVQAQSMRYSMT